MDEQSFLAAILDEPEDDTPRLVFADWLDDRGQAERAAWVRASVRRGRVRHTDPGFSDAIREEMEAFRRCRPDWWDDVKGVTQTNDRGLFRLEVRSKTAAVRLGRAAWLGQALAEGWLEGISVGWCDGSLIRVMAKWPDPLRRIPLFAKPAPQIGDDGLAAWLAVPHLWGLELIARAADHPAVMRGLGRRTDLRDLHLDYFYHVADIPGLVREVGKLDGLRRLKLDGYDRPTDDDLLALGGLAGLRELHLDRSLAVTDAGLARLAALPGLRRLRLWNCPGITDAGLAAFREARPGVAVERL